MFTGKEKRLALGSYPDTSLVGQAAIRARRKRLGAGFSAGVREGLGGGLFLRIWRLRNRPQAKQPLTRDVDDRAGAISRR